MGSSSTDTEVISKSKAGVKRIRTQDETVPSGVKRIRTQDETAPSGVKRIRIQDEPAPPPPPQEPALKQHAADNYRGVRRRSWQKWVAEIKEENKKNKICLGYFDTPEMAARAYDVAEVYLKGKKHALLNFPELIDHIPHLISLSPRHIQAAVREAAVAFYSASAGSAGNSEWSSSSYERTSRSPRNPPEASSSWPHQISTGIRSDLEPMSVQQSGQTGTSNSSLVCTPTEGVSESECVVLEEDLFESFNLFTDLAEALLLSPPPLFSVHEEEHNLEEGFLWSDF